ncbi:FAD-dependent oxidoreductase [Rudanella paleaurantiibacter]|uniref:FAD-dependent oxidoreductase n=1 Tax=Rudanella paleaurantiibacter TaxID=2614655 RepID=A0A7J5TU13_9BACT|nr:NAD(P)/FAD-dependent oxidoreductase [Rudanella paleaurantiibacter]KAB7727385.1 FAD-dependent oxidoreductase [Rudanella paleaurantiibacter]
MESTKSVIIVGGGLSGLCLAYLLKKQNVPVTIFEASDRLGGRIHTVEGPQSTPLELGATWFSDRHPTLLKLIDELGLTPFPQFSEGVTLFQTKSFEPPQRFFVPASESPSFRLTGGTSALIQAMVKQLDPQSIHLNNAVTTIQEDGPGVVVETADGRTYAADAVALCLPPQLTGARVEITPPLPPDTMALLPTVQTWMAGSIKFVLEYNRPFWRTEGYSGMLYSHAGIVVEMYDHTSADGQRFGFTGFLNSGAAAYSPELRQELVLRQLGDLFGSEALQPSAYFDKVWNDEWIVSGSPRFNRPHQNNGHPLLQQSYLNGKLFLGGTETATESPGYMEGAISSARRLASTLSELAKVDG